MAALKDTKFTDRLTLAADAKKAMLAKFKPKPTVNDPTLDERRAAQARELEELRLAREIAREEKRIAAAEAARIAAEEAAISEEDRMLALRAEQKAARDRRYAARQQNRKGGRG